MLANSTLESLNFTLFSLLNAPADAASGMLLLGHVFAQDMIVVFPLVLLAAWFLGDESHKRIALNTSCAVVLALVVNIFIGLIWPHPRPFMVPTGHTFLTHAADPLLPQRSYDAGLHREFYVAVLTRVALAGGDTWRPGCGDRLGPYLHGGTFPSGYGGFRRRGAGGDLADSPVFRADQPPLAMGLSAVPQPVFCCH